MAKAFNKGDKVTYIADWDRKGTALYRHAIVYSCGKKQMVLTDAETGEEMGRHFAPEVGSLETRIETNKFGHRIRFPAGGTFPRMTDEEAEAATLQVAGGVLAYERNHNVTRMERETTEAGKAYFQRQLDALHEPRAASFATLAAEIMAEVRAGKY